MARSRFIGTVCALVALAALAGCGGTGQLGSGGGHSGNSTVVLAMTDSPPSLVTVLSAQATLTGATLAPGNVSLLSSPVTVDMARLQTDVAYLATSTVPAGNYTSLTLTFANPSLTFENDTGATLAGCAVATICVFAPPTTTLSATIPLPAFSASSTSAAGLLVDVDLDTLLGATLSEDFSAAASVFSFTPGGTGAPPVGAEDVVGHVGSVTASSNTFTLTNTQTSYTLNVDGTTTFLQFPNGASCPTPPVFSCLQTNQILSVDIGIQSDGSLLARNIVFEDADSSDAEVEGILTSTDVASQQFSIVVHTISGGGTGLAVGQIATVQYANSQTPFQIDLLHADNATISLSTSGFVFNAPVDLVAGQEVSVRRHATLAAGQIQADRVLL
ncbi:MAG TPA: hypothetical protein VKT29_14950, partial [Terriglobales bacterium]|nr:hypothetical protein [Terriglobales bacterium]